MRVRENLRAASDADAAVSLHFSCASRGGERDQGEAEEDEGRIPSAHISSEN